MQAILQRYYIDLFVINIFVIYALSNYTFGHYLNETQFDDEEVVKRSMFPNDFLFGVSTSAYQVDVFFS